MNQTRQQRAWQRGIRAAAIWKRFSRTIAGWDRWCVIWARNHKLPAWTGHIPLVIAVLLSLAVVVAGRYVIGVILIIWALLLIWDFLREIPVRVEITNWDESIHQNNTNDNYDKNN